MLPGAAQCSPGEGQTASTKRARAGHLHQEDVQGEHRVVGALPAGKEGVGGGVGQRLGDQQADRGLQPQEGGAHANQVDR